MCAGYSRTVIPSTKSPSFQNKLTIKLSEGALPAVSSAPSLHKQPQREIFAPSRGKHRDFAGFLLRLGRVVIIIIFDSTIWLERRSDAT